MDDAMERLKLILTDTVSMLCRNSVNYDRSLKVQGLVVVTADTDKVMVVELNNLFENDSVRVSEQDLFKSSVTAACPYPYRSSALGDVQRNDSFKSECDESTIPVKSEILELDSSENSISSHVEVAVPDADFIFSNPYTDQVSDNAIAASESINAAFGRTKPNKRSIASEKWRKDNCARDVKFTHTNQSQSYSKRSYSRRSNSNQNRLRPYAFDDYDNLINDAVMSVDFNGTIPSSVLNAAEEYGEEEDPSMSTDDSGGHVCQFQGCGLVFQYKRSRDRHERHKHGSRFGLDRQVTFYCQVDGCGRVFYADRTLTKHQKEVHNIDNNQ